MAKMSHWIAIVDDDASILKALSRLLRSRAFNTKTYTSALDFLAGLCDGIPDCLIVDLQMPEMTGLELQHHLNLIGTKIPTIVITAYDEAGMHLRCTSAGASAVLSKPLQDTSLLDAIEDARRSVKF
jgi:FixJ family two-component response regulator